MRGRMQRCRRLRVRVAAQAQYRQVIKLQPGFYQAYSALARIFDSQGQVAARRASQARMRARTRAPERTHAHDRSTPLSACTSRRSRAHPTTGSGIPRGMVALMLWYPARHGGR